ncbi:hypothetical protein H0H93_010790, partial [Arthromyces matolae]
FSIWCEKLNQEDCTSPAEDALPPLDVLMVWHAYMLNPRWYAEDCTRITSLKALNDFTPVFSNSFNPHHLESHVGRKQAHLSIFFKTSTSDIYKSRIVLCPKCKHPTTTPYITPEGTGFFQPNFSIKCSNEKCMGPPITKMTLGARRFVEDLARTSAESGEVASSLPYAPQTPFTYLLTLTLKFFQTKNSGTLRTPQDSADITRSNRFKTSILGIPAFGPKLSEEASPTERERWIVTILDKTSYDTGRLRASNVFG